MALQSPVISFARFEPPSLAAMPLCPAAVITTVTRSLAEEFDAPLERQESGKNLEWNCLIPFLSHGLGPDD